MAEPATRIGGTGGIRDRLRRISATGESPDGTVRVTFTDQGPQVELSPSVDRRRTEGSLAAAAAAAVQDALARQREAAAQEVGRRRDGVPAPDLRGTPAGERRERLADAVADLDVSASSGTGSVTIGWRGVEDIQVAFRPGTLGLIGMGDAQLAAEIGAALAAIVHKRGQRLVEIFDGIYRTERDGAGRKAAR